ncbi:ABC transporter ATP-binding protein [Martelella alba]|uniref:ABC transporter ATP-binding protein n=1 Tax=Martelella alba TaxID=2590451 RepID=A0A506U2R9_9HYPH|nr:ABC transporter ATP-binding protein [Martelella alba]TPW27656.1 ABC transporter ATP-binding protein [Martelella alba]
MTGISAENLAMRFDRFTAVDDVSFSVKPGEFVTLLGPSGCGKTTLLKIISGFLTPSAGRIYLGGEDVTRVPPEQRDTALCFQSYALFPHLSVAENLEFGLKQKKIAQGERKARIGEIAEKLGLTAQLGKLPNQLSGGQQQRVSLGRALVMRPGVILFDEPLSNLDAKLRDQVRVEIRRIQRESALTAIYVTHDQAEALAMSDRIFVMNAGRVEQADTPEGLYRTPRTRFVADFIGGANILQGQIEQNGAESAVIHTPIGALPMSAVPGEDARAYEICWRPEDARLLPEPCQGALSGRVVNRAFQGHFTDLMVETAGISYRIQTRETGIGEGDMIHFALAAEDVILLEAGR